jgi:hypothetical protein
MKQRRTAQKCQIWHFIAKIPIADILTPKCKHFCIDQNKGILMLKL